MEDAPTRVLTVVLSEVEWQALRALEREPVGWLRRTIRERLERGDHPAPATSSASDPGSRRIASHVRPA
jgi:hypothetical protein